METTWNTISYYNISNKITLDKYSQCLVPHYTITASQIILPTIPELCPDWSINVTSI